MDMNLNWNMMTLFNYITLLNLTQQNSDRPKEEILYAVEDYNVKSN